MINYHLWIELVYYMMNLRLTKHSKKRNIFFVTDFMTLISSCFKRNQKPSAISSSGGIKLISTIIDTS